MSSVSTFPGTIAAESLGLGLEQIKISLGEDQGVEQFCSIHGCGVSRCIPDKKFSWDCLISAWSWKEWREWRLPLRRWGNRRRPSITVRPWLIWGGLSLGIAGVNFPRTRMGRGCCQRVTSAWNLSFCWYASRHRCWYCRSYSRHCRRHHSCCFCSP